MSAHKGERSRITVRLPTSDLHKLEKLSETSGFSVNEIICHMLARTLQGITNPLQVRRK